MGHVAGSGEGAALVPSRLQGNGVHYERLVVGEGMGGGGEDGQGSCNVGMPPSCKTESSKNAVDDRDYISAFLCASAVVSIVTLLLCVGLGCLVYHQHCILKDLAAKLKEALEEYPLQQDYQPLQQTVEGNHPDLTREVDWGVSEGVIMKGREKENEEEEEEEWEDDYEEEEEWEDDYTKFSDSNNNEVTDKDKSWEDDAGEGRLQRQKRTAHGQGDMASGSGKSASVNGTSSRGLDKRANENGTSSSGTERTSGSESRLSGTSKRSSRGKKTSHGSGRNASGSRTSVHKKGRKARRRRQHTKRCIVCEANVTQSDHLCGYPNTPHTPDGIYRHWKVADWSTGVKNVYNTTTGQMTITDPGVYWLYAQVTFLNAQPDNGFGINVTRHITKKATPLPETMARCLQSTSYINQHLDLEDSYVYRTCHTALTVPLQAGDKVYIVSLYPGRQVIFERASSFWGLTKLSQAPTS